MKSISHKVYLLLLALFTYAGSGCDDFLDVNSNPNALADAPLNLVLSSSEAQTIFVMGSDMQRYTALIMQYLAAQGQPGLQVRNFELYQIQPADVNTAWRTNIYAGALADFNYIIEKAGEQNSPKYAGIAKILQGFLFSVAVDAWGDVPFSEALEGKENRQPTYDDDATIYPAIIALIDEGIADIKATASTFSPGADDLIYGGNMDKWEKFANTLKLRLYLHYSESDPGFAATQITELINSGGPFMASIDDNFQMAFENVQGRQNPIHQYELARQDQLFPSVFFVDLLNSRNDPRRSSYFTTFPYGSGNYQGAPPNAAQATDFSRVHTYLRGDSLGLNSARVSATGVLSYDAITYTGAAPIRVLTYAEYNFIQAEAALRFGVPGDAQAFFAEGIRASMTMARVPVASINAYVTAQAAQPLDLQKIITEKYIANYGVGLEPWTDWRRTGYPTLTVPSGSVLPATARILPYPQQERDANPKTPTRVNLLERVFWDTRQ